MATVLDTGLLQTFDIIFPFLIVFALVFAILQKTKATGGSIAISAVIGVATAFLVILSKTAVEVVNFMIPWFTIALIFFILLLLIFQTFGAKDEDILSALKTDKGIGWAIVGIAIVIMLAALGNVFGQSLTEKAFAEGTEEVVIDSATGVATPSHQQNLYATLFHPKVLGLITLFAIAIFAVALLTGPATP